jgi:hypothetical protein
MCNWSERGVGEKQRRFGDENHRRRLLVLYNDRHNRILF